MTTMVDRLFGWTRRQPGDTPERPQAWLTRISIPEAEQPFDVLYYQDEAGWYVAEVPELPGCVTQAEGVVELRERIAEAISLCREVRLEQGMPERENLAEHPRAVAFS